MTGATQSTPPADGESVAMERTTPAMAGSSARSRDEMWRMFTQNNTR